MRQHPMLAALFAAMLTTVPASVVSAQDLPPAERERSGDGLDLDLLKQEFDRVWDDLVEEAQPTLDRLGNTFDTLRQVDDLRHYEDPVIMENGDILIRRREGAPPLPEVEDTEESPYGEGGTAL
ncbi:MAG: hypothetical protein AAF577_03460 [Pseudomonadota bacterium]